jgi:hypothetical protein
MKKIKQFFRVIWHYITNRICDTCGKLASKTYHTDESRVWIEKDCRYECEDCTDKRYGKGKWLK